MELLLRESYKTVSEVKEFLGWKRNKRPCILLNLLFHVDMVSIKVSSRKGLQVGTSEKWREGLPWDLDSTAGFEQRWEKGPVLVRTVDECKSPPSSCLPSMVDFLRIQARSSFMSERPQALQRSRPIITLWIVGLVWNKQHCSTDQNKVAEKQANGRPVISSLTLSSQST